jgi:hypothetical protein
MWHIRASELPGDGWIGHWSPGIGDPTIMGWLTVVLYAFGAWQCYRLATKHSIMRERREVAIWWTLSLGLLALGLNKQLDLQTALTEIGRIVAVQNGWYERRHDVQLEFIYGVVGVASLTAVALIFFARKAHPATILALVGSAFLVTFVVMRAASFHHFDLFIKSEYLGLQMNWMLEMGGICIIIASARMRLRTGHPRAP